MKVTLNSWVFKFSKIVKMVKPYTQLTVVEMSNWSIYYGDFVLFQFCADQPSVLRTCQLWRVQRGLCTWRKKLIATPLLLNDQFCSKVTKAWISSEVGVVWKMGRDWGGSQTVNTWPRPHPPVSIPKLLHDGLPLLHSSWSYSRIFAVKHSTSATNPVNAMRRISGDNCISQLKLDTNYTPS